jgi:hypothetical protein
VQKFKKSSGAKGLGILGMEPDIPSLNVKGKDKGKIHPRKVHEGPERE